MKKISPEAIVKLKNALWKIYWYRNDLRSFVAATIRDATILSTQDWSNTPKKDLVDDLIGRLVKRDDLYQEDILALIGAVSNFSDFSHLERLEDGAKKAKDARDAVAALNKVSCGFLNQLEEKQRAAQQQSINEERLRQLSIRQSNLNELKDNFCQIIAEKNPQKQGFLFEKFLYDLFLYFELDPKRSFKISGEQIDGAFSFDGIDYLLEAKWEKVSNISKGTLLEFGGKVGGKLDNTLGVFVSYNGFTAECQSLKTDNALKPIFLISGSDLMMVLDSKITLPEMLLRKRRHAAQRGELYLDIMKNS